MEFVGRAVAVATSDTTVEGTVAKVEEGRLHVSTQSGKTVVLAADQIVDLQVLAEGSGPRRTARPSSDSPKQGKTNAEGKRGGGTKRRSNPSSRAGSAAPSSASSKMAATRNGSSEQSGLTNANGNPNARPASHDASSTNGARARQAQTWDAAQGEFDFEASNRQFDKKAVFESIKSSEPPVSNAERTVYRPNEMVLTTTPWGGVQSGSSAQKQQPLSASFPVASALQNVQVQSYMLGQGWSARALDESAGRGIAAVALRSLGAAATTAPAPTAVIFCGNHNSGARALAGGRLLATRGISAVAVLVDAVSDQLERELPAFKAAGGLAVSTQKALFAALEKSGPVGVVIDALQGLERASLADQVSGPEQLAASRWLVGWANNQNSARLAVERVSTHADLTLHATALVSCGWPLPAESSAQTAPASRSPARFVVDLGVPRQVLAALRLTQLHVNFGMDYYVEIAK